MALIILQAGEVRDVRAAFGLDGGPALSAEELRDEIMVRGQTVRLANGWKIARRRHMSAERIEIEGPADRDLAALKRAGCTTEIVAWRTLPARPAPRGVPVGACYATDKASRPDPCPQTRMPRDMPVVLPSPLYRKCVSPPGNTRSTNGSRNRISGTARFPSAPAGAAGGSKTAAAVRMPSNAVISP